MATIATVSSSPIGSSCSSGDCVFGNAKDATTTVADVLHHSRRRTRWQGLQQHQLQQSFTGSYHLMCLNILLSWEVRIASAMAFISIIFFHFQNPEDAVYVSPRWQWDHNVYNPKSTKGGTNLTASDAVVHLPTSYSFGINAANGGDTRNLLLLQLGGSSTLDEMASISSRPNRAYARQWGRDYALYSSGNPSLMKSCFDKVVALNTILDKQDHSVWPLLSQGRVEYDVMAIFPPDAIITNLDYDLLKLIPPDRFLAMPGWESSTASTTSSFSSSSSFADIFTRIKKLSYARLDASNHDARSYSYYSRTGLLFINLRHKYAHAVADLWWKYGRSTQPLTCEGANYDEQVLINVIQTILDEDNKEERKEALTEHDDGYINERKGNEIVRTSSNYIGGSGSEADSKVMAASSTRLDSLIYGLEENDGGFVGQVDASLTNNYGVKGIIPSSYVVPTGGVSGSQKQSREFMLSNDADEIKVKLQTTADSVCYRFYPKCEVL